MEEFKEKPFKDDWYFEKLKVFMKVYGIEMSKVFDTKEDKSNVLVLIKGLYLGGIIWIYYLEEKNLR